MIVKNPAAAAAWTVTIDETWVAWLTFDRPATKVNTFTTDTLAELAVHIDALAADERIKAVAIRSGKDAAFIAGADIDELALIETPDEARAKSAAGHEVFAALAALPVPTVAVIHGACMGGGLEMALACTYRLVSDDPRTKLALPEVNLGILPGWGGTQRLPRLVGMARGLELILAGKTVVAKKAYAIGLADGIVAPAFLEGQTRAFIERVLRRSGAKTVRARRRAVQPRITRFLEALPGGRALIARRAARTVQKKTKGCYPAPVEALAVVRATAGGPLRASGFAREAEGFARLACTPISRNLVWLFQGSQRLKRAGGQTAPGPLRTAGVVGAGIMGGGIAWALAGAGLRVRLKDIGWDAVAAGLAAASDMFRGQVKRRRLTAPAMTMAMHRIGGTVDYSGFANLDVVVEAVVEDLAVKRQVLSEIEANVRPDTIICTNTSSLSLAEMSGALRHPKRFVGLHFFNPVNRMQLVEVVPHRKSSRVAVATAVELVKRLGKLPVVVGDCPGFLVNRILLPYLVESAWMLEEGASAERIDDALERFGMPMGPLALVDEVGIDTGYKVAKVLESAYGPRMRVAEVLGRVVDEAGLKGRKSGRGFYVYDKGGRTPNRDLARLLDADRGPGPDDAEIVDRAVLIMVNEAARCLDEGIVGDPETLDMAMVMGTGFAPFRGGLLRYADARGVRDIKERLDDLAERCGDRFRPVPLIDRIAGNGNRFYAST